MIRTDFAIELVVVVVASHCDLIEARYRVIV
jgi:hypothetical protein